MSEMNVSFQPAELNAGFGNIVRVPAPGSDPELAARLNGELFVAAPALTERVSAGTKLRNPLWANKAAVIAGYALDNGALYFYGFFGAKNTGGTQKSYRLFEKDSQADPYELTLENAPNISEFTSNPDYYKFRAGTAGVTDHLDYRILRIMYDANGVELERIYSAQYRYFITGGQVSRVRVETAAQNPEYIIDIGLQKHSSSVHWTMNTFDTISGTLLPLVSTPQTAAWDMIVPDSMFAGAANGLTVCAVRGDGLAYQGPTFGPAPYAIPAPPAADGEYALKVTVSGGIPVFSWE